MVLCTCCKSHRTIDDEEQSHSTAPSSMSNRPQDLETLNQTLHKCNVLLLFIVFNRRVGISIYMFFVFFLPGIWMEYFFVWLLWMRLHWGPCWMGFWCLHQGIFHSKILLNNRSYDAMFTTPSNTSTKPTLSLTSIKTYYTAVVLNYWVATQTWVKCHTSNLTPQYFTVNLLTSLRWV